MDGVQKIIHLGMFVDPRVSRHHVSYIYDFQVQKITRFLWVLKGTNGSSWGISFPIAAPVAGGYGIVCPFYKP